MVYTTKPIRSVSDCQFYISGTLVSLKEIQIRGVVCSHCNARMYFIPAEDGYRAHLSCLMCGEIVEAFEPGVNRERFKRLIQHGGRKRGRPRKDEYVAN